MFSFISYHPYGLSSIVLDPKDNLFIVAGNYGKEPFESDMGEIPFVLT